MYKYSHYKDKKVVGGTLTNNMRTTRQIETIHGVVISNRTTPICYSSQLNQYEDDEVKTSVTAGLFTTKLTVDIYISSSLTTDVQRDLVSHFEKRHLLLIGENILKIFNNRGIFDGNMDDLVSSSMDNKSKARLLV